MMDYRQADGMDTSEETAPKCFYPALPGVFIPAALFPYAVYCTCHMGRPTALVPPSRPEVIPEL